MELKETHSVLIIMTCTRIFLQVGSQYSLINFLSIWHFVFLFKRTEAVPGWNLNQEPAVISKILNSLFALAKSLNLPFSRIMDKRTQISRNCEPQHKASFDTGVRYRQSFPVCAVESAWG